MKRLCPVGGLRRAAFVGMTSAALVPRVARAVPLTPLRIVGFRSYSELPLWIAQSNGFFTRENLDVTLAPTPGSVYQFQHLSAGDFDLATTALDNVIAYDEGQTTTELSNPPDFVAIMGGDSGSLKLWVRPEIGGYADLHGKTFAVDAPSTGFSFILRRMLAEHGLNAGDYRFDAVGNTERRFALMQAGPACSGALLDSTVAPTALAAGFHVLQSAAGAIGPYVATVVVARRAWLDANGPTAVRFLRGVLGAIGWMNVPANRDAAGALLANRTELTSAQAQPLLADLLDPDSGVPLDGAIRPAAARTVLQLRSAYAVPQKTLTDVSKYVDLGYLREAREARG